MLPSSLRGRLVLGGALLAVVSVVVTAWLVTETTSADLIGDVDELRDAQSLILSDLSAYAVLNGDWDDADSLVEELARETGTRIALTTLDGRRLIDSDVDSPLPPVASAVIDPGNPGFEAPPSEAFIGEAELATAEIERCLEERGIAADIEVDDHGGFEILPFDVDEFDPALETCFDQAFEIIEPRFFEEFDTPFIVGETFPTAEPALLFLGAGPQPSVDWGIVVAAATGMVLLGSLAAALMSGLLTRPLRSLAAAAGRVREGDLSARVEESDSSEIGKLGGAFNEMAGELERADERRKRFTSDVAHELRTPLTNVTSHVEAMIDGIEQPAPETLETVRREVEQISGLVDDLQQLALADEGQLTLSRFPVVLDDIVEAVSEGNRPRALESGVELIVVGEAPEPIELDPRRVRQALDNVVANALAHTPSGGRVSLAVRQDAERTTVAVTDTGPGIPEEFIPFAFDRFARADQARTRAAGGTGLGLPVARELVRAHGGEITIERPVEGGTRVVIELPGAE
ncbi:MAG: sensor histidine kinase [Gaiellaceae bacterium]